MGKTYDHHYYYNGVMISPYDSVSRIVYFSSIWQEISSWVNQTHSPPSPTYRKPRHMTCCCFSVRDLNLPHSVCSQDENAFAQTYGCQYAKYARISGSAFLFQKRAAETPSWLLACILNHHHSSEVILARSDPLNISTRVRPKTKKPRSHLSLSVTGT